MKKFLKNEKGFTLVELMVVIAIIGILAAVLVPKMGFMKDSARTAGLDANSRLVEASVNSLLPKYTTVATLEAAIDTQLEGNVTNPFTNATTVLIDGGGTPAPAVYIYTGQYANAGSGATVAGSIGVACYLSNGILTADIWYFDKAGAKVVSSQKLGIQ